MGKTHSVRSAAADAGAFLVPIAGTEGGAYGGGGGEMAMALRDAFERARRRVESRFPLHKPSIYSSFSSWNSNTYIYAALFFVTIFQAVPLCSNIVG